MWLKILLAIVTNIGTIYKIVEIIYDIVKNSNDPAATKAEIVADIKNLCTAKGDCSLQDKIQSL